MNFFAHFLLDNDNRSIYFYSCYFIIWIFIIIRFCLNYLHFNVTISKFISKILIFQEQIFFCLPLLMIITLAYICVIQDLYFCGKYSNKIIKDLFFIFYNFTRSINELKCNDLKQITNGRIFLIDSFKILLIAFLFQLNYDIIWKVCIKKSIKNINNYYYLNKFRFLDFLLKNSLFYFKNYFLFYYYFFNSSELNDNDKFELFYLNKYIFNNCTPNQSNTDNNNEIEELGELFLRNVGRWERSIDCEAFFFWEEGQ